MRLFAREGHVRDRDECQHIAETCEPGLGRCERDFCIARKHTDLGAVRAQLEVASRKLSQRSNIRVIRGLNLHRQLIRTDVDMLLDRKVAPKRHLDEAVHQVVVVPSDS